MIPRITFVSWSREHTLFLRFDDGSEGEVDLSRELEGSVFEPLKDVAFFRQVVLDSEIHTVVWPNGADFAPEFLYEKLRVAA